MSQMEHVPIVQSVRTLFKTVSGPPVFVLATVLAATALPSSAEGLPDGPGKDLVEAICSECHTTERIATQQLTKPQWEAKVLEMLQEAPDVKQSERDKIVEYLAKYFPARANVNKANAKELQVTLEIPPESATAIVSYRQTNGSFKTLDDLKKVPGVDAAKLDSKREIIDFKE
jgi:competence protein ComEA